MISEVLGLRSLILLCGKHRDQFETTHGRKESTLKLKKGGCLLKIFKSFFRHVAMFFYYELADLID